MTLTNAGPLVVEVLKIFEDVFEKIADLAGTGILTPEEDCRLSEMASQLHSLHQDLGERVLEDIETGEIQPIPDPEMVH